MSQINTIQQNAAADNLRKAIKRKFPQTSAKVKKGSSRKRC